MGAVGRVMQFVPVLIGVVVIAIGAYYAISVLRSPMRAKEIFIFVFTIVFGVLTGVTLLSSAYALFESNWYVLELTALLLGLSVAGLAITRLCRWRLLKKNPKYKDKTFPTEYLKR